MAKTRRTLPTYLTSSDKKLRWTLQGSLAKGLSQQGSAVAISADSKILIVGGPDDENLKGATWIFYQKEDEWCEAHKIVAKTTGPAGQGTSVALSGDGLNLAVGAPGDNYIGSVRIYRHCWSQNRDEWREVSVIPFGGLIVCLSFDGETLTTTDGFKVHIYLRQRHKWNLVDVFERRTSSLVISSNGSMVVAGGEIATIYSRIMGRWQVTSNLYHRGNVAISSNGNRIVVGSRIYQKNNFDFQLIANTTGYFHCFDNKGDVYSSDYEKVYGEGGINNTAKVTSLTVSPLGDLLILGIPEGVGKVEIYGPK